MIEVAQPRCSGPPLGCGPHRLSACATRPIFDFRAVGVLCCAAMNAKNKLYFGDNLKILREHVPDASVDLIYLDPPFNSSANYNVLFKEKSGEELATLPERGLNDSGRRLCG